MKKKVYFVALVLIVFLAGCSQVPKINVAVDAYLDKQELPDGIPAGSSFFVVTDTKDQPSLLVKEVQSKVERALEDKGYKVDKNNAAYCLLFRFFNGTTKQKVDVVVPSTSHVYAYGNSATVSSSPAYASSYDVVTYYPSLGMFVYDIDAYKSKKEEKLLWQGGAVGVCNLGDFRYTSNFVIFSLMKYFGQNTGQTVSMSYPIDSSAIKAYGQKISLLNKDSSPVAEGFSCEQTAESCENRN